MYLIVEAYKELYPEFTPLIFLDEIQNIKGWDKFARRLQDEGYQIYVTGSNAKLLSKEISTALRGRSISVEVFPMSFKEFISFKEIKLDKNLRRGRLRPKDQILLTVSDRTFIKALSLCLVHIGLS